MVPILTTIFIAEGFPKGEVVHLALGTSMAGIVFTSISSLRAHHAHGAVLWSVVRGITPVSCLAPSAQPSLPRRCLPLGWRCSSLPSCPTLRCRCCSTSPKPHRELPGPLGLSAVGLGIGGVSALVAIGGGTMSVPFMTWCNVKAQHAIGTSAAIGLPIALAGTIGWRAQWLGYPGLPGWTLGFRYLPGLAMVVAVSMLTAPTGAKLAHRLPVATLNASSPAS